MDEGFLLNDKYIIIGKVGTGAFSICYKAQRIEDNEIVCVKLCSSDKYSFKNEFEVSLGITKHERLLKCEEYDLVNSDENSNINGREYVVSEFMPNGDLLSCVNKDWIDEECVRLIFKQILAGIESLHNDGYAHMDIKLGNILIDSNFFPRLADFGYTIKVPKDRLLQSCEYKSKGTKHYISPEILEGTEFNAFYADIFSLGVVMFTLLIGDFPFDSATIKDKKYCNFYKKCPKIFWAKHSKAKKRISKGLVSELFIDLITKMLLPNPDERIKLDEIKLHDWYQQPSISSSNINDKIEDLKSFSKSRI